MDRNGFPGVEMLQFVETYVSHWKVQRLKMWINKIQDAVSGKEAARIREIPSEKRERQRHIARKIVISPAWLIL